MRSVLLIDDDLDVLSLLETAFRRAAYSVLTAQSGEAALALYARDATDLVILDLNLPDVTGLKLLARFRALDPDITIIVITGQSDVATAVKAIQAGAENFLPKPMSLAHLYAAADRAFEKIDLRRRAKYLEERVGDNRSKKPLGESPVMRAVANQIELVAPMDTNVLVLGETGTGKSWVARRIHGSSRRAAGPFVDINCACLSSTFLESELFGHEKGAFTDAKTMRRGLFEMADGGTLFLDEIGDLALDLQPKLLTAIESRRFRRLGGTRDIRSNVRLISATNRKMEEEVTSGRFREDLYYRIAVMPIHLPALRERTREDREQLARELMEAIHRFTGMAFKELSTEALDLIADYHWPGNIREMRNVLERALILAGDTDTIKPSHLPPELARAQCIADYSGDVWLSLEELERRHIARVLEHCRGNRSEAARILGISRVGLYKKLRRLEQGASRSEVVR